MAKKRRREYRFTPESSQVTQLRQKESRTTRKIVRIFALVFVVLVLVGGFFGYRYISTAAEPVDPSQTQTVEVQIPQGSSVKQIATILEEARVIKNARLFNFFLKFKNVAGFKAGYYELSPSMNLDQVVETLTSGGSDRSQNVQKVLVREGDDLTTIAQEVANSTNYSADEFMSKVQDSDFISQLAQKFPNLLGDAINAPDVKYVLEGYVFPATYDVDENMTLQQLIEAMVSKTDEVMSKYYTRIAQSNYSVHQVLTLASLVEKEGVTLDDRQKIASVFFNRLRAGMMLQTDISVLYALGEHKEVVTLADLEVDSPYNLYRNYGMGPGPYDSPSEDAIVAVIEPANTNFLYFVADIKTKQVYFAETYEEHLALQAQYVDNKE